MALAELRSYRIIGIHARVAASPTEMLCFFFQIPKFKIRYSTFFVRLHVFCKKFKA